jgi:hypothetical protein
MSRIKGANSDYQFSAAEGRIVEQKDTQTGKWTEKLFLQIFLCPYEMPSLVEPPVGPDQQPVAKPCVGLSAECPHGSGSRGHTLIYLHEDEGIRLQTDNNQLIIDQAGSIKLLPTRRVEVGGSLVVNGQTDLTGRLAINGPTEVAGSLVVKGQDNREVRLQVAPDGGVAIQANGASVAIDRDGNVDLTPKGRVKVSGNLEVTGELTLSAAMLAKLKEALAK